MYRSEKGITDVSDDGWLDWEPSSKECELYKTTCPKQKKVMWVSEKQQSTFEKHGMDAVKYKESFSKQLQLLN